MENPLGARIKPYYGDERDEEVYAIGYGPGGPIWSHPAGLDPATTAPSSRGLNSDVSTTAGDIGLENAPEHYKGKTIEPFDLWDAYDLDPFTANALKYLLRWNRKTKTVDGAINDLKKAHHYVREFQKRLSDGRYGMPENVTIERRHSPEAVVHEFDLTGDVAAAVRSLLYSRLVVDPHPVIEDVLASIDNAVERLHYESH